MDELKSSSELIKELEKANEELRLHNQRLYAKQVVAVVEEPKKEKKAEIRWEDIKDNLDY